MTIDDVINVMNGHGFSNFVIDDYFERLQKYDADLNQNQRSLYCSTSFVSVYLLQSSSPNRPSQLGGFPKMNFLKARKFTYKYQSNSNRIGMQCPPQALRDGMNIFEYKYVFLPVLWDSHYFLVVIDIGDQSIHLFDSLVDSYNYTNRRTIVSIIGDCVPTTSVPQECFWY
jgi:hypothetical protein